MTGRALASLLLALALSLVASGGHAEQAVRDGDVIIHYSAVRTTLLTPEIATRFGVRRSRNQALLVLNAQRDSGGPGLPTPIAATATGHVTSLLGHRQVLKLTPRQEGDVHYVLARFETLDGEFLTLDLMVTPEGHDQPIPVRWQQQFYND
ncbi:MAG: DUF4426 domain-containing protein [Polycyclovorans sp.]|jgi:hypothetical protein|nr:hypothetical protein [Polycyclovorans sp.]MDP1543470.1 DUF4426 domain-containing protein [Polycyclovorans sp.]|tara:strand:- start:24746 stop:25198 length:453 start_codon:yes stop_codon:yes gene_type:complete